jgi:hypothetical protein
VLLWVPILGFTTSIAGIILSVIALKEPQNKGFAIAGLIMSILSILINLLIFIGFILLGIGISSFLKNIPSTVSAN